MTLGIADALAFGLDVIAECREADTGKLREAASDINVNNDAIDT
ncbi:hypothetical protein [Spongiactinospora sp. TRM90649]|nr:hypothetical protein [Spongiactinospora sp. TRM90649]MDF5753637.1 hypothetical protein [Spongiactinospora sp. TRM90649]